MDIDELRSFIGLTVRIFRNGRLEGEGELLAVNPGSFPAVGPNGEPTTVEVEDYSLTYVDTQLGELPIARRASCVWRLEAVA